MDTHNNIQSKILTIPNILSFFRLLLIPVFIWMYIKEENYLGSTIILIISGITDVLDGFIARKFNLITDVGKVLDPVADKLTQASVLFCMIFRFKYMLILFIVLFIKETILGILGIILYKKEKVIVGALWHGKVAAMTLYIMLFMHLFWFNIPEALSITLASISFCFMMLSLVLYTVNYLKMFLKTNKL